MLLVIGDAVSVDPLLFTVVSEVLRGHLVTLILFADTLNSLDDLSHDRVEFFRGSPYLL